MANPQSLATETKNVTGALTSMRIDELIANLATGIARGQLELDRVCMQIAEFMSRAEIEIGKIPGTDEPDRMSLIELGFTPNFYQFVDTILELRVSVSCSYEQTVQEDRSDLQYVNDEQAAQSSYSNSSSSSSSGSSSGYGGWSAWWWGGSAWGGGASSSSSSSSSAAEQAGSSSSNRKAISMQTVDAKFSSTYNYSLEASSTVKTKIVPVPPPPVFEEVLRAKLAEGRARQKLARLRNQAIVLIKAAGLAAQQALDVIDAAGDQFMTNEREAIAASLANVRSSGAALSNELWAAIGSVDERRSMDEALDAANNQLPLLADAPETAGPALVTALTDFLTTANAIAARPING